MRKKKCLPVTKSKRYVVRYFSESWEEEPNLRRVVGPEEVMIETALWLRSRIDDLDQSTIILSLYHAYPYISIEEGDSL